VKKILVTIFATGTAILIIICVILYQISIPRGFSIETTARKFNFIAEGENEGQAIQITAHPFIKSLTVSAERLRITTSEFIIAETNEPKLKGARQPDQLETNSTEATYYNIQNNEIATIPVIISVYPKQRKKIGIEFNQEKEGRENITDIELPAGKASINMSSRRTTINVLKSEIIYGNRQTNTEGKEIQITGTPDKIDIAMEGNEQNRIKIFTIKGKPFALQPGDIAANQIINPEFYKASKETTIYLDPKEKLPIKGEFIEEPDISIRGKIRKVKKVEINDEGISATLEGEFTRIKIAETEFKNTALEEVKRFFGKIPEFVLRK
jgi:translation initiation factor 2 beta subunit (eIF-2beta)/eIF-5